MPGAALAFLACTPSAAETEPPDRPIALSEPEPAPEQPSVPAPAPSSAKPRSIADDESLTAGLVEFKAMVRPVKGGLDVRGVTLSLEELKAALPEAERGKQHDELLGVRLLVVAELEARHSEPQKPGEPAIQTKAGSWFSATKLVSAEIIQPAVEIQGVVRRSKGLFSVGKHMVTSDDLSWSLSGAEVVGKKVRLWGQPRTYHCPPESQCLIGGQIPMFDVARAEIE